jgi:ABC-2 type transport system ATP-binding protein
VKVKLYTEDSSKVIDALVAYAHAHNLTIIIILTLGPGLDDVFVKLTGLQRAGDGIHAID